MAGMIGMQDMNADDMSNKTIALFQQLSFELAYVVG